MLLYLLLPVLEAWVYGRLNTGVSVIIIIIITVTARHTLDLKRVLHLSAGQCPAHMALEAVSFLTDNFARCRLI